MKSKIMDSQHEITNGDVQIEFRLRRSNRRTLGITVHPDLAVEVTAPRKIDLDLVKAKVRKRAGWIRRQQSFFRDFLPKTPPRCYVSGETHRYLGRQYRLKVVESDKREVKLRGRFIWVHTPRKDDRMGVRKLVESWYLARAKERFARSLADNALRLGARLSEPPKMQIRRMLKRWGSWTPQNGIWVNPELVKASATCIDYVLTHELCHAVHGHHGKAFYELLQQVMPDWQERKARLERTAAG
jgi:predicted metal-dependent hydrolase